MVQTCTRFGKPLSPRIPDIEHAPSRSANRSPLSYPGTIFFSRTVQSSRNPRQNSNQDKPDSTMKFVAACVAAGAAMDCASAFVAPVTSSVIVGRTASSAAVRARSPLKMSAVATDAMVSKKRSEVYCWRLMEMYAECAYFREDWWQRLFLVMLRV